MRRVSASVPFHCCPKISLRLCGLNSTSKLFFRWHEGRHESFAGGEREVRVFVHCKWRGQERARPSHGEIVGRASEQPWIDRKSTRLNSSHRCISYAVFCM